MDGESLVIDAVTGINDGLIIVDAQTRLIYRNRAAERMVGIKRLDPDSKRWSTDYGIFHPDEKTPYPSDRLPLVLAVQGIESREVAMFVRNEAQPQGVHILVTATTIRDSNGGIRGAASVFRDVTIVRAQQAQLREGTRQKEAILDNIPDIAWLKDQEGRFLVVNQRFMETVGTKPVIGYTDLDLWPTEIAEAYRADDAEIMRSGEAKRIEEPFVDANGSRYWLETIKRRIVDDSGKVIGTTGIARDITERKQQKDELERRVLERTAELAAAQEHIVRQERLAVLGQLAGGVAHQIRNPLAAILNATYVLRRHMSPDQHPNVTDSLHIIHDEVRHANIIITSLLDYARVRTPDRHPASVSSMVERTLLADWIPANVRIERLLDEDVELEVDVDQLQDAVSNLVRNAIDAMPDGGVLGVELRTSSDGVTITVTDTGTGISPQVRPRLFEPLHSTKPLGIGLGLVTARRFVEAHGGRIKSIEVPTGAKFEIWIPR